MRSVMHMCFDYDFIKIDTFLFEDFFNTNFLSWKNSKNATSNNSLESHASFAAL